MTTTTTKKNFAGLNTNKFGKVSVRKSLAWQQSIAWHPLLLSLKSVLFVVRYPLYAFFFSLIDLAWWKKRQTESFRHSSLNHSREPGEEICVLFLAFPIEKQIHCHVAGWSPTDGRGNRSWFTSCRTTASDLRSDPMSTTWFVGFFGRSSIQITWLSSSPLRLFSNSESKKKHQTEYEKIRQAFDTSQNSLEKNTIDYPRMEKAYQFYQKCRAYVYSFLECYNEKVGPYPSI